MYSSPTLFHPTVAPHVGPSGWDSNLTRALYGEPAGPARTQILNYGGGTQTTGMIALCLEGRLPWPDHIVMADTGREATATWDWLREVVAPVLAQHGRMVEVAPHSLATVDLLSTKGDVLMPMFTDQSGQIGQLATYCSAEWKTRVVQRYLTQTYGLKRVDNWIGYSSDEASRMGKRGGWQEKWRAVYPLLDLDLDRDDIQRLVTKHFGQRAPKSSCWMCPHRGDAQWRELRDHYPQDWQAAIQVDEEMRRVDPHVYLHRSGKPLSEAPLTGQAADIACSADGGCWT